LPIVAPLTNAPAAVAGRPSSSVIQRSAVRSNAAAPGAAAGWGAF
jgi:hypothetical protein